MRRVIGSDRVGFVLKGAVVEHLEVHRHPVTDIGASSGTRTTNPS